MNQLINFAGGRPLYNDDLQLIQNNITLLSSMLQDVGPCIVSGCDVTVDADEFSISEGLVLINKQLVYFAGASSLADVYYMVFKADSSLFETELSIRDFGNVSDRAAILQRQAQIVLLDDFDDSIHGTEYIVFYIGMPGVRLKDAIRNYTTPTGSIIEIPSGELSYFTGGGLGYNKWQGWALCDGRNGTVDKRGYYAVGYANYTSGLSAERETGHTTPGAIVGANSQVLSLSQMPPHNHGGATESASAPHTHNINIRKDAIDLQTGSASANDLQYGTTNDANQIVSQESSSTSHTHGIGNAGGGAPIDNRPLSRVSVFVQRI